jgi:hypothetical protein
VQARDGELGMMMTAFPVVPLRVVGTGTAREILFHVPDSSRRALPTDCRAPAMIPALPLRQAVFGAFLFGELARGTALFGVGDQVLGGLPGWNYLWNAIGISQDIFAI